MNILITAKMTNEKLRTKILPLSNSKAITGIYLLRDTISPPIEKVSFITPPSWSKRIKPLKLLIRLTQMIRLFVKQDIDAIVSFYLVPNGVLSFLFSKIVRKPFIISLLGSDLDCLVKKGRLRSFYLFILKNADVVVVRGTRSKEYLIDQGLNGDRISIIHNCIDLNKFRPQERSAEFDLISVGYLRNEKRLDILLDIMKRVEERGYSCLIVGDGPLEKEISNGIETLGLSDRVKMVGYRADTENFFNASRSFILTSEREGLPQVVIEAMACGLPCIVPNVGDIPDIAKDGISGMVVDPLNVPAYAEAITTLLEDSDLMNRMGQNAISSIGVEFSMEAITAKWEEVLS